MTDTFWDQRFAGDAYVYGTEPNAFLAAQAHRLRPGMQALAVADGEGRNGVWLAGQGLVVLSVDSSRVGLAKARRLAEERRVGLGTLHADLLEWSWPGEAFDVVVSIFIHFVAEERRRVHAAMVRALRPGGILILEAFHPDQLNHDTGGPRDSAMLYTADMLRADFAALIPEILEERVDDLAEGAFHRGSAALTRFVGVKP